MNNFFITVPSSAGRYVKPIFVTRKVRLDHRLAPVKRLMERKPHGDAGFLEENNIPDAEAEVISSITTHDGSNASYFSA